MRRLLTCALLIGALAPAPTAAAAEASLSVTTTADTNNGACDADCSLREAVIAANASPGNDTVVVPAGTYELSLGGRDEDGAASGDLDITDPLTIEGASTDGTILDGGLIDRVFHIDPLGAGGVAASLSDLTIRRGAVGDRSGGGIASFGDITLRRVRLSSNRGEGSAALDAWGTTLIEASTITGNGVTNWAVGNGGTMTVRSSTVSATTGFTDAGHGFSNQGSLTIENSSVSGNDGRGIDSSEEAFVRVDSSTITGNGGVSLASGGGDASVGNSILAGGVTNGDCLDPVRRQVFSRGHNLVNAGAHGICGFTSAPSDVLNADPKLGALAANGGPTETHALLSGSPAVDAGDDAACPATDQRGIARPQGPRCDIGAFEAEPAAPGNTPAGNPQLFFGGLTISFTNVAPPGGDTTVNERNTGPAPPAGFEVVGTYYEIATTATFEKAELCFSYSGTPAPSIVHFENGVPTVLVTTRDTGQQVCAEVTSFSPFVLVVPVPSDTEPPELDLPSDMTVDATSPSGAIVNYEASATDAVDPSPALSCSPASGATFAIGQTIVACMATDASGNSASGSFVVTVRGAAAQLVALIDKTLAYLEAPALEAALRARLEAAAAALVDNKAAACRALAHYIAAVTAAPSSLLSAAEKADLVADATRIRAVIGCA
jgi:CSLREA domain-containing protein